MKTKLKKQNHASEGTSPTPNPNAATSLDTVLLGSYAEDNNLITIGTSAPTEPLPDLHDEDIRYREEREKIVTKAVNDGLAAAKALYEIKTYRDGLLWRKEFRTFADYCASRWGYQKSQAYRHVQAGGLLAMLEQADSPIGDNAGITESHLRPVLENVPEELQVACWQAVTKSIPETGKLTAAHVKNEAKHFLEKAGVEAKKGKLVKPTKPDDRESAMRDVAKLRTSLARLPQPERFYSLLQDIQTLIDQDPDEPIRVDATEVVTCDRNDPAPAAHSERNGHAEAKVSPVSQQEKGDITAEIVAAAMAAVAPPHEQSMGTAKLEKDTTASQRNLPVTDKCVSTATAESESQQDSAHFMSAQLFHDVLHPGEDYTTWLGKTAESHPNKVRIPSDEGAASISLVRARSLAYNTGTSTGMSAFKLINEAQSSSNSYPGTTADALFKQHALTANHSSS